jgi:hypothetical protein
MSFVNRVASLGEHIDIWLWVHTSGDEIQGRIRLSIRRTIGHCRNRYTGSATAGQYLPTGPCAAVELIHVDAEINTDDEQV